MPDARKDADRGGWLRWPGRSVAADRGPPAAGDGPADVTRSLAAGWQVPGPAPAGQITYRVAPGDWLGVIAERYLGSFDRYHDIQTLNTDRIPRVAGPDGPDHIHPGWRITLPADAHDRGRRPHATGHLLTPPRRTRPTPTAQTAEAENLFRTESRRPARVGPLAAGAVADHDQPRLSHRRARRGEA